VLVANPLADDMLVSVIIDPAANYDPTVTAAPPPPSAVPVPIAITPVSSSIPIAVHVAIPPALSRCRSDIDEGD
jgi:hypothetical protein